MTPAVTRTRDRDTPLAWSPLAQSGTSDDTGVVAVLRTPRGSSASRTAKYADNVHYDNTLIRVLPLTAATRPRLALGHHELLDTSGG